MKTQQKVAEKVSNDFDETKSESGKNANNSGMIRLTRKQYNSIHRDYRGKWEGYSKPEWTGRRTAFESSLKYAAGVECKVASTRLMIEGIDFEIY